MTNQKTAGISVALAALAVSVTAFSAETRFYGGAGLLGSNLEPRVSNTGFRVTESGSAGARIFAGVDLTRRVSIEGYYTELGYAELSNQVVSGELDYQAVGLTGLLYLYGNRSLDDRAGLLVFARAGIGFLNNSSTNGIRFSRLNNEHLAAGIGVEYGFRSGFGLRAEFLNHDQDASEVSLSVVKRFGGGGRDSLSEEEVLRELPVQKEESAPKTTAPAVESPPPPPPPPPEAKPDSDADGVLDNEDKCANTVAGANVGANGCVSSGVLPGVNFETGSAALTQGARNTLDGVILELNDNPELRISVHSHTDNKGDAANNMELSRQRAVTVVRYLADVGRVDLVRMSAVGFGESEPLQSNNTLAGRAANRRVEIEIIAQ